MAMIKVINLTFSYDGGFTDVFENVNFTIDTSWKLGFVGRNGRGKTTFLKLLLGEYEYSGDIVSDKKFTYFPFDVRDKDRVTLEVLYDIAPAAEYWQIVRELNKLDMSDELLFRTFCNLSGGERTKILLAGLFLNDDDYLLIDEPTNHLDARSRAKVAEYLSKKSSYILVSHDRAFLDGCVDHILSINKANIEVQSGNFSSWLEEFDKRQTFEYAQNEKLKKEIAKLSDAADRAKQWARRTEKEKNRGAHDKRDGAMGGTRVDKGYIGHKAAKMTARAKAIVTRKEAAAEEKSKLLKNREYVGNLKLSPLIFRGERLFDMYDAAVQYDGGITLPPVTVHVDRGERVALCGKNGCGKSSILKLLTSAAPNHTGRVTIPSDLTVSYVPQHAENLVGTPGSFAIQNDIDQALFKTILCKMDFKCDELDADIARMSEGQKKKLLIAKSLCENAHIYVWDEPLNYIDIYSRMQIEKLIIDFCPTMLFVEHDAAFINNIATRIVNL